MKEKTKVLILGTYHFAECGEHKINIDSGDIDSNKKQKEVIELVQRLKRFAPNKIAIEKSRDKEKEINELYLDYCMDNFNVSNKIMSNKNEVVQVGFRLGKVLNHRKIYPIDFPVNLPESVFEYAEKKCPEFYKKFMKNIREYGINENEFMRNNTVCEIFKHLNAPERIEKEHSDLYLHLAQVGAGDTYDGVDMLTEWYRRNLYIFGNLQDIAEEGDRILVIYGAGHCKILRDFVNEYKEFEFVNPLDYL